MFDVVVGPRMASLPDVKVNWITPLVVKTLTQDGDNSVVTKYSGLLDSGVLEHQSGRPEGLRPGAER